MLSEMLVGQRALFLLVILLAVAAPQSAASERPRRATWVWSNDIVGSPAERDAFLKFCRKRRIDVLFLYAPPHRVRERSAEFHALLAAVHAAGLRVEALDGAPEWAFEPEHATSFAQAVLAFNREAVTAGERFDALHLDVEPYQAQNWKDAPEQGGERFLEMLRAVRAAAGGLPLTADVPAWFAQSDTGDPPLLGRALEQLDAVAVMAYVERARRVQTLMAPALALAAPQGKQVWAGISVQRADADDSSLLARKRFEELVRKTESGLRHRRGFHGVAIHDAEHLRELYPGTR